MPSILRIPNNAFLFDDNGNGAFKALVDTFQVKSSVVKAKVNDSITYQSTNGSLGVDAQ